MIRFLDSDFLIGHDILAIRGRFLLIFALDKLNVRHISTTRKAIELRRSRSFKVTDFATNRKLICDFLLVINTNLPPILHCFQDIAFDRSKIAIFGYPSCI